jgi:hypothetical protein
MKKLLKQHPEIAAKIYDAALGEHHDDLVFVDSFSQLEKGNFEVFVGAYSVDGMPDSQFGSTIVDSKGQLVDSCLSDPR